MTLKKVFASVALSLGLASAAAGVYHFGQSAAVGVTPVEHSQAMACEQKQALGEGCSAFAQAAYQKTAAERKELRRGGAYILFGEIFAVTGAFVLRKKKQPSV